MGTDISVNLTASLPPFALRLMGWVHITPLRTGATRSFAGAGACATTPEEASNTAESSEPQMFHEARATAAWGT